ncbi:hypothetical protein AVEN_174500-1 [Araneus ventricosus]|uniref:Uncharacterized protein n=1 Tax=Araneus ventricosus TaxID=182803 RepID=A0A4Y2AXQ1_ARAVE|nr:hypothetical protein AVEN_8152-1 [Araneus ventricosus]GBL84604.1 hypothetical protein AVEN_174500-1 [Araneus ventricosus]
MTLAFSSVGDKKFTMFYKHKIVRKYIIYKFKEEILSRGHMTGTAPALASRLQASAPHQRELAWPPSIIYHMQRPHIHGGSSMESGFEPRALWPRCHGSSISALRT